MTKGETARSLTRSEADHTFHASPLAIREKLIFNISSAYAKFERDIIRDRVIAGIKAKREKTGAWARKEVASDI